MASIKEKFLKLGILIPPGKSREYARLSKYLQAMPAVDYFHCRVVLDLTMDEGAFEVIKEKVLKWRDGLKPDFEKPVYVEPVKTDKIQIKKEDRMISSTSQMLRIAEVLKDNPNGVEGPSIAKALNTKTKTIWTTVDRMRKRGFKIDHVNKKYFWRNPEHKIEVRPANTSKPRLSNPEHILKFVYSLKQAGEAGISMEELAKIFGVKESTIMSYAHRARESKNRIDYISGTYIYKGPGTESKIVDSRGQKRTIVVTNRKPGKPRGMHVKKDSKPPISNAPLKKVESPPEVAFVINEKYIARASKLLSKEARDILSDVVSKAKQFNKLLKSLDGLSLIE